MNKKKEMQSIFTFLFSGRALNFGILAIISSSSSAVLFTLMERTRWAVSSSGSLGLVNVSLGFIWKIEVLTLILDEFDIFSDFNIAFLILQEMQYKK